MKKLALLISCTAIIACATSAFASVKVASQPEQNYNGQDYVGDIVAAEYVVDSYDGQQSILIMTLGNKLNHSNLAGLTLKIDDKDLPFGLTLANSVGKEIAVIFKNANYDINSVDIITDKYWNGSQK